MRKPIGPYADENGTSLRTGGGTKILGTHGVYIGPDGQSAYADTDHDLLVYHNYYLGFDSAGWPYVY